ncbi:hypothetical protein HDA40_007986 [Hamadaea flava]|uniref:Heparinase n=1 Tax=Hamadaea flava TaxID=1742688 RepID=A0ABV8LX11_9ACTN|nr:hypothetical protein [Hamadaea flava]MCP2329479.1 hypothetical protein [Hamadaea flava]
MIDTPFVTQVHAGLIEQVRSIAAEARAGGWTGLQHRRLAERLKVLVAAWRLGLDTGLTAEQLFGHAVTLTAALRRLQGPSGLFTGGDNVDSPPDSAFSVNDLADIALMLRLDGTPLAAAAPEAEREVAGELEAMLTVITPALLTGGVHTPNHRWELSAALARLHRLWPLTALAARVEQWLAEGVDLDDSGLYSERSANYAAHVSNPSLLVIGEVFGRTELLDAVERNLDATLDLLLPDGSVETILSRRQDQRFPMRLSAYLLPLREIARIRKRPDLAWAAQLALTQGLPSPGDAATLLVLNPDIALELPPAEAPARRRRGVFPAAGLVVDHRPAVTSVVFGGSDHPRQQRIRSGLANSPTFLRLYAGAAVLDSVRLSRTFFGLGPFRADGLTLDGDTVTLAETVSAAYYQPLDPADRDPRGEYALVDDGRFSAAMDFGRRVRDEVGLDSVVKIELAEDGVELTLDLSGAVVDWALEFAFRPGGSMTGVRALRENVWQLDASAGTRAEYRVGDDVISIDLSEASDGAGEVVAAAHAAPSYEPGEEYRFLGGTDAAAGELLYVSGRVPACVRLKICVANRSQLPQI